MSFLLRTKSHSALQGSSDISVKSSASRPSKTFFPLGSAVFLLWTLKELWGHCVSILSYVLVCPHINCERLDSARTSLPTSAVSDAAPDTNERKLELVEM